ncbi:MAG TPA: hypothetical protein VFA77_13030 [Candidatus Eisenbacteria bacterium]|jgi:hypothetical protein|nr:hypothetical protein [Candidatus Eisenbacteria bacterium]
MASRRLFDNPADMEPLLPEDRDGRLAELGFEFIMNFLSVCLPHFATSKATTANNILSNPASFARLKSVLDGMSRPAANSGHGIVLAWVASTRQAVRSPSFCFCQF